ncbi:MAG: type ISP restriction/modification enzyme, partial [Minisyncoccia bacterium]
MSETVKDFIQKVIETHNSGHAREHSYRPALKELFEKITELKVINEPKRSEYGAPDFVFLKNTAVKQKIVIAYAEAKDIDVSLDDIEKSKQMDRYYGYSNIILTNGLEFRFYRNTAKYTDPIIIGKLQNETIEFFESSFQFLEDTIKDFIKQSKEPIKSGSVLAKVMAWKARRIRDNIKVFLAQEDNTKNENLLSVYEVIKKLLLADLDKTKFADMYAQTLVYGLFVARYYDDTPENFSRQEARDLVPASNPFLRHFFDHIAGSSFDPRIEMIVNELCEEFTHTNVQAIVHDYYKVEKDGSRDPIIHFYEDFLQEYDSSERKRLGVFYTPLPVVRFIIRSIDDILKKEFDLLQGLADASKIEIAKEIQGQKKKIPVHRVQVLDPATGTGTFLNEAILHIKKSFEGQEGRWSQYVNSDLLPRLHGFELMMASYTIAHLKLSSTIRESGAKIENTRLGVYLTNSLEKGEDAQKTLFDFGLGKAITDESEQANKIKNDLPIMVVMGNPPYSGVSSNETDHANSLVEKYKIEPGGKQKLQERKHWLNDDYVKFIAFAENMIAKNKEGIVGFITNHGYLDNPTFRGMRWHLMDTFDSLYVIDLHGNSKKKEVSPDGGKDENVFAIQQGVAIMIAVKTGKKRKGNLAKVFRLDIWGNRESKFDQLRKLSFESASWNSLKPRLPNLVFAQGGSIVLEEEYQKGFSVDEIFKIKGVGVVTARDALTINVNEDNLWKNILKFSNSTEQEARSIFELGKDVQSWKVSWAQKDVQESGPNHDHIKQISYRPFDVRYCYYTGKSSGFMARPSNKIMNNFITGENIGLILVKQFKTGSSYQHVFVSRNIT